MFAGCPTPSACIANCGGMIVRVYVMISVSNLLCLSSGQPPKPKPSKPISSSASAQRPLVIRQFLLPHQTVKLIAATARPLNRPLDGGALRLFRRIHMRALVQADHHVAIV